ncbi:hypothetical protein ABZ345_09565 [Lentzea sp. NPDC005914]|uniref:hypothetical protein n=1 Tax=Lentzea sp. NPDC005914 TaxID=3154572 RepID=UPI0033EDE478
MSIGGSSEERFAEEFGLTGEVSCLDDRTMRWRLGGVESPTRLTIAVAWSGPTELPATWWAVDLP